MFAQSFSLEATRPTAAEVAALVDVVPPGTPVYLTAVPHQSVRELGAAAAGVRKAGFEPVAHIGARRIGSADDLKDILSAVRAEADMRRVLVIGGDVDSSGPFADALTLIQKGRLREAGIEDVGIGAYPEGHNRIAADRMEAALDAKLATIAAQGLRAHIVSQFSFSPERIVAWLRRLRACGINTPIKVGMAGPTSMVALLRYAKRCGVNASLRGLASGAAAGLVGHIGPDRIVKELSAAEGLGDVSPHYFSFGGLGATARYAREAAGLVPSGHAIAQSN